MATSSTPPCPAPTSPTCFVDDLLSAEEKAARDSVARFMDAEVLPITGRHFRDGAFPAD
ncbi:acyl-CoA dehydrogenase family protein [Cystobacter ferrugineus]|uniref:acyl-CoA dehydrogenase family protein n=1 Tax=Cystobacter ferrugineus TaxID=83449 RepID=UPI000AB4CB88|nr:acyl-CoA dehydrogenase family protein [Cystobacter ferrugineus]